MSHDLMSAFGGKDINKWHTPALWVLRKENMNDRTKADKAWEARQSEDENYFAVLDQAGNAAEAAAAEITGYKTYADLLEALDTRRKQS
jgi:hypothetical protein